MQSNEPTLHINESTVVRCRASEGDEQHDNLTSDVPANTAGDANIRSFHNVNIAGAAKVHFGDTIIQNDTKEIEALIRDVRAKQSASIIQEWLRAPDATIDYNVASSKRHEGTGRWLVESAAFRNWLREDGSFLWLNGFAGCGKSVLCSTAIQAAFGHGRTTAKAAVAFFFFTFNDEAKRDASALLRALLSQISSQIPEFEADMEKLSQLYKHGSPHLSVLLDQLRQAIQGVPPPPLDSQRTIPDAPAVSGESTQKRDVYILLDALDECPIETSRSGMLSTINTIRSWHLPNLHLLVTSRDLPDIRDELDVKLDEIVTLGNGNVDDDILSYVQHRLEHDRQLKRWGPLCQTIEQHLTQRANGIFRWVDCQLQPLRQCPKSKYDLEQCLQSLPRSLDETYERMLISVPQTCQDRAHRILTLLCFAARPLKVPEILDAIAIDPSGEGRYDPDQKLEDPDDLLRVCPGLIEIHPIPDIWLHHSNTPLPSQVQIAHFSVQEYLTSRRIAQSRVASFAMSEKTGHAQISKMCLVYLCNEDFVRQPWAPSLLVEYAFGAAAAWFWHHHYRSADPQHRPELERMAVELLRRRSTFTRWVLLSDDLHKRLSPNEEISQAGLPSAVYCTSFLDLPDVLERLLSVSSAEIDSVGPEGSALQMASTRGHEQVVRVLVRAGVNVESTAPHRREPALHLASAEGHEKIVRDLIDAGANVNGIGGEIAQTALETAISSGHEGIVRILLDAGADTVPGENYLFYIAYLRAGARGQWDLTKTLVNARATVDACTGGYSDLLIGSLSSRYRGMVPILIEARKKRHEGQPTRKVDLSISTTLSS